MELIFKRLTGCFGFFFLLTSGALLCMQGGTREKKSVNFISHSFIRMRRSKKQLLSTFDSLSLLYCLHLTHFLHASLFEYLDSAVIAFTVLEITNQKQNFYRFV